MTWHGTEQLPYVKTASVFTPNIHPPLTSILLSKEALVGKKQSPY